MPKRDSGLWLGGFGKSWLFRCQSGIRRLWLTAFGKKRIFMCQSTFAIRFCQRNCVFLCKGTKAAKSYAFCVIRRSRILGIVCRFSRHFFSGLWLVTFGKLGLFRCQSTPGPPYAMFPYLEPAICIRIQLR